MSTPTEVYGSIINTVDLGKRSEKILPSLNSSSDEELEVLVEDSFTWHIDDWFSLTGPKYASPRVKIGDFEWDLLLFPQGNHNKGLAVYVEPHPKERRNEETGLMEAVDPNWYCCAQFAVCLSRPEEDSEINLVNKSHHRFDSADTDWGFANLIDLNHLKYPSKNYSLSFLKDGQLNVTVYVRILKDPTGVLWHNFVNYDSKKVTGYVGFRNQGATCYLNSLLQSYFFTKYFRKLVYQIPTENESPNDSVPLALQRAFYQLQVSDIPLDTLELTRSFGWDSAEAFTQHDVQELNRILMDRLENRMKGTPVEGKLNELFVGKMKSYIKCINVDYESSRVEDFWDLQLNVKNLKGLEESFKNYIEIELMNGENQYAAQDFGLQDAEKGVIFESFPPILHLQLKRFEYDFNYDQLIKINDRYEFPESIDVSPYMDKKALRENKESCKYTLHGVLVHTGDISTGHYYAMIKPDLQDQWYRFDDEKVWKVTKKQVFEENFGMNKLPEEEIRGMTREQYQNYLITRHTSAYMLVYIREDKEPEVLQPVSETDVPSYVVTRVEKETQERVEREKEIREAHLFLRLNIHSMKNFINYEGFDISSVDNAAGFLSEDLNDGSEQPLSLKLARTTTLKEFYKLLKESLKIHSEREIKYWKMEYRKNNTLRIAEPIPVLDENTSLEEALEITKDMKFSSLNIFVEEPYLELHYLHKLKEENLLKSAVLTEELIHYLRNNIEEIVAKEDIPKPTENLTGSQVFLLLKKFDPLLQRLVGFCHCIMGQTDLISEIGQLTADILDTKSEIQFFEEISAPALEKIHSSEKLYSAELRTGDILSFQTPDVNLTAEFPTYKHIEEFYEFLRHRVKLRFTRAEENSEEYVLESKDNKSFEFWISAYAPYDEVAKLVSTYAQVDPDHLKIFAVYANGRFPLKSKCVLNDYLIKDYNCESIPPFEYEILSISLKELEQLRPIKFYWLKDSYIHYQSFEFEVSNTFTIRQFLEKIQNKIGFSDLGTDRS